MEFQLEALNRCGTTEGMGYSSIEHSDVSKWRKCVRKRKRQCDRTDGENGTETYKEELI